jgi:hypothetical protein
MSLKKKVNRQEYEIDLINYKKLFSSLIFLFPLVVLKYHFIKNWIKNLQNTATNFSNFIKIA